ncbi:MAG: hypothetical protein J5J00_04610 [Deltaproteobacteria bacterium]|nr:hypothetical protein [Deltaproteobacteria bacterium]
MKKTMSFANEESRSFTAATAFLLSTCLPLFFVSQLLLPGRFSALIPFAIFAVLAFLVFLLSKLRLFRWELFISFAALNLFLITPEVILRWSGFRFESGIHSTIPNAEEFRSFVSDKDLLWKLSPDGKDVNSMGFLGPEVEIPKPSNTIRSVFLGDSCTYQGYPKIVKRRINKKVKRRGARFEAVNLALPGYSSYQGKVVAEKYALKVDPDVAVIFYGWNDHWLSRLSDEARAKNQTDAAHHLIEKAYGTFRTAQFFLWLFADSHSEKMAQLRVPLDEYKGNLIEIAALFQRQEVPVLFVTAPTTHYINGVPPFLVDHQYGESKRSIVELHKSYAEATREAAVQSGAKLIDLEDEFSQFGKYQQINLFTNDGIHFSKLGNKAVAKRIAKGLKSALHLRRHPK